jgi:hypothetical protein
MEKIKINVLFTEILVPFDDGLNQLIMCKLSDHSFNTFFKNNYFCSQIDPEMKIIPMFFSQIRHSITPTIKFEKN